MSWMHITSLPEAERWGCDTCARNGLTVPAEVEPIEREEPCPEKGCIGRVLYWPAGANEPAAIQRRRQRLLRG